MSDFLDKHGALVILFVIVMVGLGITTAIGWHAHIDPDKLFAWFGGFTMGAFSGLMVALRIMPSQPPTPVVVQSVPPTKPAPSGGTGNFGS